MVIILKTGNPMPRLPITAVAILAVALSASACSRNKDVPTHLAPSRMTAIGVNAFGGGDDTVSRLCCRRRRQEGVIITTGTSNPSSWRARQADGQYPRPDLRADALGVAASRQINQSGVWVNAPVAAATVQKLEDIILTRARDLRRTSVAG
jgi:hypothetical protein